MTEIEATRQVVTYLELSAEERLRAQNSAAEIVAKLRNRDNRTLVQAVFREFELSSAEGIALMQLVEAFARISDDETADRLIAEKLAAGNWAARAQYSETALGATICRFLALASNLLGGKRDVGQAEPVWLSSKLGTASAAVMRRVFRRGLHSLADEFVVGDSIASALERAHESSDLQQCSFDVLGESARTSAESARYFRAYQQAIAAVGAKNLARPREHAHAISVKLSALEPRYSLLQRARVLDRLVPRVIELTRCAARAGVALTIDAEEADRLDISLDVIEAVCRDSQTQDWDGFGCAVQAYNKQAGVVIEWLAALAHQCERRIAVRLVKGAYWDAEIKRAQERALDSYPVYTLKAATDVSYLAAAKRLFKHRSVLFPQFATHNAATVMSVLQLRPQGAPCEYQRLHGMGADVYAELRRALPDLPLVRVYAPVGEPSALLAYLVRRLLENGANSSFLNRHLERRIAVEDVVRDPVAELQNMVALGRRRLCLPVELFGGERRNSRGVDVGNTETLNKFLGEIGALADRRYDAAPVIAGLDRSPGSHEIRNPARQDDIIGTVRLADGAQLEQAFAVGALSQPNWDRRGGEQRAKVLEQAASLLAQQRPSFMSLLAREGGKTLGDALAEVREAEDFCRYYAARAREQFGRALPLPGPVGETNELTLHGRGVFACISPWNFPLAIFMGQVTAALAAGNAVVAKPASATPLIADLAVALLHEAGVPREVLSLTPSSADTFARVALQHPALAGIAITGSTATAMMLNRALALRSGPIVPLIAETGGLNAMIVDATALIEQVVDDVIVSAFASAGQRCSALRLLFVEDRIADSVIEMLVGAMDELCIGDPADMATDVGPVINADAVGILERHAQAMRSKARVLRESRLDERHAVGSFFAPRLYELQQATDLTEEIFGPILHLVRYRKQDLQQLLQVVRDNGYGLTLGVHSRLHNFWRGIVDGTAVGNYYVNRTMIGAVVGVQPFGGRGLSGTGPKAGGPHYLQRFAVERVVSVNVAAAGGVIDLLGGSSDRLGRAFQGAP